MLGTPQWPATAYSFDEALASGAFGQLALINHSQFASLADKRGVKHVRREMFEWLDKQGALRPIAFETNSGAPTLHSERFSRWDRYARNQRGRQEVAARRLRERRPRCLPRAWSC